MFSSLRRILSRPAESQLSSTGPGHDYGSSRRAKMILVPMAVLALSALAWFSGRWLLDCRRTVLDVDARIRDIRSRGTRVPALIAGEDYPEPAVPEGIRFQLAVEKTTYHTGETVCFLLTVENEGRSLVALDWFPLVLVGSRDGKHVYLDRRGCLFPQLPVCRLVVLYPGHFVKSHVYVDSASGTDEDTSTIIEGRYKLSYEACGTYIDRERLRSELSRSGLWPDPMPRVWAGMLRSNAVTFEVVDSR